MGGRADTILSLPFKTYFSAKIIFKITKKGGCLRWKIANISPKMQGNGSFLLPCSKMSFGALWLPLKSDFQKRENGEKQKTRENLGFFGWHLFCQDALEAPPGFGPGIRVLQTRALPLGHGAIFRMLYYYSRTRGFCQALFWKRWKEFCTGLVPFGVKPSAQAVVSLPLWGKEGRDLLQKAKAPLDWVDYG